MRLSASVHYRFYFYRDIFLNQQNGNKNSSGKKQKNNSPIINTPQIFNNQPRNSKNAIKINNQENNTSINSIKTQTNTVQTTEKKQRMRIINSYHLDSSCNKHKYSAMKSLDKKMKPLDEEVNISDYF